MRLVLCTKGWDLIAPLPRCRRRRKTGWVTAIPWVIDYILSLFLIHGWNTESFNCACSRTLSSWPWVWVWKPNGQNGNVLIFDVSFACGILALEKWEKSSRQSMFVTEYALNRFSTPKIHCSLHASVWLAYRFVACLWCVAYCHGFKRARRKTGTDWHMKLDFVPWLWFIILKRTH
jgi:hypothetical protein